MTLKRTALYDIHRSLGAKVVDFGGWEMPLSYPSGTVAEHMACRNSAVVFDVSHLGTVRVAGEGSFDALQAAFTNDLGRIEANRAQYTHLLDPIDASVVDDIIVWWRGDQYFDVMPNASNTSRVLQALGTGRDVTTERAILAVQGPQARVVMSKISSQATSIGRFRVGSFDYHGFECTVAGTGYTGEDGLECAVPNEVAERLFHDLIAGGAVPAGLGARDTLRLEAGLPLHGHELGPSITPYEANLGWVVASDKAEFIGKSALEERQKKGLRYRLFGVRGTDRSPLRAGMDVVAGGKVIGILTSGNFSPVLKLGIGLALLPPDTIQGSHVKVQARGRELDGTICEYPFVSNNKSKG